MTLLSIFFMVLVTLVGVATLAFAALVISRLFNH